MLVNWFYQQHLLITRAITVNHTHAHTPTKRNETKQKRPQNRYNLKRIQLHLNACSNRKAINQKENKRSFGGLGNTPPHCALHTPETIEHTLYPFSISMLTKFDLCSNRLFQSLFLSNIWSCDVVK